MMICLTEPSSIYSDHIIMWWGLIEKLHEHGLCLVTIKFMETQKSILASEIFLSNLIIIYEQVWIDVFMLMFPCL